MQALKNHVAALRTSANAEEVMDLLDCVEITQASLFRRMTDLSVNGDRACFAVLVNGEVLHVRFVFTTALS